MKRFFAKGLMALLPLVLTAAVLYLVISFLYTNVGVPIGDALKWAVREIGGKAAEDYQQSWFFRQGAPILGFALAIVLTLVAGFFAATFLGKKLYQLFEAILSKVPIIKVVYPYARQFTEFFFSDDKKKMEFKHPVAIPFPAHGIYSLGFVTGDGMKALNDALRKHMLSVFVPTSPTPFTGYVIYIPREEAIPIPISVEEAMRIIISMGVIHPAHQAVTPGDIHLKTGHHLPVPEALAKALEGKIKNQE